jgi:hypothetical protein
VDYTRYPPCAQAAFDSVSCRDSVVVVLHELLHMGVIPVVFDGLGHALLNRGSILHGITHSDANLFLVQEDGDSAFLKHRRRVKIVRRRQCVDIVIVSDKLDVPRGLASASSRSSFTQGAINPFP